MTTNCTATSPYRTAEVKIDAKGFVLAANGVLLGDVDGMERLGWSFSGRVECQQCDAEHEASYSHDGRHGEGPIFAVVCTVDGLTDYYTTEALR